MLFRARNGETGALMGSAHRKMLEDGGMVEDPLREEVLERGHRLRSLRADGVFRSRVMKRSNRDPAARGSFASWLRV